MNNTIIHNFIGVPQNKNVIKQNQKFQKLTNCLRIFIKIPP